MSISHSVNGATGKPFRLLSPIIIESGFVDIYGVLRTQQTSETLVILFPGLTGSRIGPQRIYVEIAHELLAHNIASFCLDIPPSGDSIMKRNPDYEGDTMSCYKQLFSDLLDILYDYFKNNYAFKRYIILAISDGCLPVYYYSSERHSADVILLSPNHDLDHVTVVNKKNLKNYYLKLFTAATWVKLFTFRLNYKKIYNNIFRVPGRKKAKTEHAHAMGIHRTRQPFNILYVFGEKERNLEERFVFWESEIKKNPLNTYQKAIINGADHSFFGWQFKKDVSGEILKWLTGNGA